MLGPEHQKINLAIFAVSFVVTILGLAAGQTSLPWYDFGLILGQFIHPDLDLNRKPQTIWELIWYFYGKVFKHRHLSHVIFIGTVTRILYVLLLVMIVDLIGWAFSVQPGVSFLIQLWNIVRMNPNECVLIFMGISVTDVGHILSDHASTNRKVISRRWRYGHQKAA